MLCAISWRATKRSPPGKHQPIRIYQFDTKEGPQGPFSMPKERGRVMKGGTEIGESAECARRGFNPPSPEPEPLLSYDLQYQIISPLAINRAYGRAATKATFADCS
jgi:hypothetical protein